MIDPTLENDLRLLTLQVESWKKLHDFITYALDKAKPIISVEQERQFTEIRSILFQESEHVFDELRSWLDLEVETAGVLVVSVTQDGELLLRQRWFCVRPLLRCGRYFLLFIRSFTQSRSILYTV